jgi:peptide/nickel transport system substrate-binding protein
MKNIFTKSIVFVTYLVLITLLFSACTPQTNPTAANPTTVPAATNTTQTQRSATPTEALKPTLTIQPSPTTDTSTSTKIAELSKNIRLDPANISDKDSSLVISKIYEGLVRLNKDGKIEGALARDWTVSEDKLDYIFYLRPNVTFHDGTILNADIVLANFNRWFDPKDALHGKDIFDAWKSVFLGFKGEKNPDGTSLSSFDGIEKVDNLTVLLHLNRIDEKLLNNLANPAFSILNPTILQTKGVDYGTMNGGAVGTGPYMIDKWTGDSLVLSPYKNYWDQPSIPTEAVEYILK